MITLVQSEKERGCAKYSPPFSFNSHMLYKRCRQGNIIVFLHIPETGNMWRQGEKVWKDTYSQLHTQSHVCAKTDGDIYHICTWMNHLYYNWPRETELEQRSVFFPRYSIQAFSNVILMLLLEVWLEVGKRNESTAQTETPTQGVLKDRKMEG